MRKSVSEENLTKNLELRTSVFHINEIFEKQLQDIQKRKKSKFTYTLGSDINTFSNLAGCDIIVFVKEDGVKKSAGEIAKDLAKGAVLTAACLLIGAIYIPIPRTAITIVHLAVVDGNDGAILWYNNNMATPDADPENQKQLAYLVKSIITPFPDSAFKKKETKKGVDGRKPTKEIATVGKDVSPVSVQPSVR